MSRKKADRVALMMPNILQYPICIRHLTSRDGRCECQSSLHGKELEHQLNDSGANTIVLFANSAHIWKKLLNEHAYSTRLLLKSETFIVSKSLMINFILKRVKSCSPI